MCRIVPLPDDPAGRLMVIGTDISAAKQAEESLRASEARLRVISDAALDAVVMIDGSGNVVHWNPAAERMFGFTAEEAIGRPVHAMLVPERYRESAERGLHRFMQTGEGAAVGKILELSALCRDGTELPVEISVAPIQVEGVWRAVAIVRDITERKRAGEEILRERELLRQLLEVYDRHRLLAATEAHDGIAQPLAAVLMSLECGDREQCPEKVRSVWDTVVCLVRESLDATRHLMNGLGPPILEELGVVAAIGHLVAEKRRHTAAPIEYVHDVDFDRLTPPLETAIFRIVEEALANALRHSDSPTVRIEVVELDRSVRLMVEDRGKGFDPEQVDQKFFGLRGIRERARLFGGHVTIQSTAGEGTRITAELPLPEIVGPDPPPPAV
jgi:two-component system sensor kinase